jgi:hypothetical protein
VRIVHPDAVHTLGEWQVLLGLPRNTLKREARLGRLRVSKRAGRLWSLGVWVVDWIVAGEVKRRVADASLSNGLPGGEIP